MSEPLPNESSTPVLPVATFARTWGARHGLVAVGGALTLVSLTALMTPSIPLGVPGEWTWARRAWSEIDPLACVWSLLLGAAYWGVVRWGEARSLDPQVRAIRRENDSPECPSLVRTWGSRRQDIRLAGLCLLAFAWLFGMLSVQPDFQGLGRAPTVLFYKRTEGYFWQAAFDVQNTHQFLAGYRDLIASGDDPDRYLHLGTHPPGLTLMYRGLLSLFKGSPRLTDAVISLEPYSMQEAFAALRRFPTPQGQLSLPEEATLWAATLLTLFATAATCWPIYRLASRMGGPVVGWRAAALWPLVPSLLVFFPKSDLLCPFIATTSCWLWLDGWSRLKWGRCALAGLGFFCGLMLTLALAPIALLLVIQTILERWTRREEFHDRPVRSDIAAVVAAIIGFLIPLGVLSLWGRCNIVAIWFQNLQNHAMFYDHNSRSYGKWLVVNPIEAALALGLPLACLVAMGLIRSIRERVLLRISFSQALAWFSVWAFLWLSGKNMGEAARLWIFLAPWPVMTAAVAMSPKRHASTESALSRGDSPEWMSRSSWGMLLILQLFATIWIVSCVDGFHFAELMGQ